MKNVIIVFIIFFSFESFGVDQSSYQEEFVFLKNQLELIKSRKNKTISQLKSIEGSLNKKNAFLTTQVASLSSKNDVLKTKMTKFDENRSDKEFSIKKINVVLSQMKEASLKLGFKGEGFADTNKFLLEYLGKGTQVYKKRMSVFNTAGVQIEGESVNLGHTASFFSEGNVYRSLVSGAKKENLYFGATLLTTSQLNDSGVKLLPLEFKDSTITLKKTFMSTLSEKLDAGGAVGYIIIILGLIGLGIAVIRYNIINVYAHFDETAVKEIVKNVQKGNIEEAKKCLYEQRTDPLTYFIDVLFVNRHKKDEVYESIVIDEISRVQNKVSKYGPYLIVLAAVAPLLGLLGTVTGMIGTFEMITIHGTGNPKILSGGIKEALVTTQMGLVVAIPCILAGNFLSSKASKIVSRFEEIASSIPKV